MKTPKSFAAGLVFLLVACGSDDPDPSDASADVGADTDVSVDADAADTADATDVADPDTERDTPDTPDADVEPDTPVVVEGLVVIEGLEDELPPAGEGNVSVYQIDSEDQIPEGTSVQAIVGDWIIESDRGLFVVEGQDRTMSPCPWGGSVIDAIYFHENGSAAEETLGEICTMVNLGQTFDGREFEILEDGSEGRAVLAVTGDLQQLDFLNIEAMASGFLGGLSLSIALDPGLVRPISVTVYYALTPDSNTLRVVTGFRNDGQENHYLAIGHLLRPAGQGVFFNPLNADGGYGYRALGPDNLTATPVSFTAYTHSTASWAYVPDPVEGMGGDLPVGGGSAAVAGVTAALMGTTDLLGVLLAQAPALPNITGITELEPGEISHVGHNLVAGGGSLATTIDSVYGTFDIDTASVGGFVRDSSGEPVAGIRVTAIDGDERGLNQAVTAADGSYEMIVPAGITYEVRAFAPGRSGVAADLITPTGAEALTVDIDTADAGQLTVNVTTPDGVPTVARLTVACEDRCPRPLGAEMDLTVDDLPSDFAALVPVGIDGTATVDLAPGNYGVIVSRGLEWSLWPADGNITGGEPVEIVAGETVTLDAEIAHVVDTSGAVSGDFHVHALASSDSSVANEDRLWSFVSDGLDVVVSTDHDYIIDYAPIIEAEGIGGELASFVGVETTTSSYGHINSFPLEVDEDHRTGGAIDWGNGAGLTLTPAEVYGWAHDFPGEQVVQINHPEGTGTINGMNADVLLGISRFSAEQLGMEEQPANPDIEWDTGFWSDDFTAIEIANGLSRSNFNIRLRWWLTMIGRGFHPTGTAVTDTHRLYSDIGAVPRTFAFVSEETDAVGTIDTAEYMGAINEGRTIGTNGPFFRAELRTDAGDTASFGDTITLGEGLTLDVQIDIPEWMSVDQIDLYMNVTEGIYSRSGGENDTDLPPTFSVPVELTADDLEVAAAGAIEHRHYVKTVSIPLEFTTDGYVVIMLRGVADETRTLWPVVPRRSENPFAFSNPIFVDADGGGYDNYPLQGLIDEILSNKSLGGTVEPGWETGNWHELPQGHSHSHSDDGWTHGVEYEFWTREWAAALAEQMTCEHDRAQ